MAEELIIDCINVNECEFYGYDGICKLYSGSVCSKDCSNYPNCNYKQLKRKEQECEKLKRQLNSKFGVSVVALIDSRARAKITASIYKQALDNVEKMCKDHPFCDCSCGQDILDIINKTKKG